MTFLLRGVDMVKDMFNQEYVSKSCAHKMRRIFTDAVNGTPLSYERKQNLIKMFAVLIRNNNRLRNKLRG